MTLTPHRPAKRRTAGLFPTNIDLEIAILGSVLVKGAYDPALGLIPDHFTSTKHQVLFAACRELARRGIPPVPHTVAALEAVQELIGSGALDYLVCVLEATPYDVHLEAYALMLKEKYAERRIIEVQETNYLGDASPEAALDAMRADLERIPRPRAVNTVFDARQATSLLMEARSDPSRNIASGLTYLDQVLNGGLATGELITLAGRPGQGKTTLALNWGWAALTAGKSVGVMSFEMQAAELVARMVAADTNIPANMVVPAHLGDHGAEMATRVSDSLAKVDGYSDQWIVDQRATATPEQIWARVLGWRARNLDLLIVDHLQLTSGDEGESRVNQLDRTTRELKALANEMDIAVLAVSQLNRQVEQGARKPGLSDLRDSGAIEQNSDAVLMLHRPEVKDAVKDSNLPVKVELLVRKNRNGEEGAIGLSFWRHHSRFETSQRGQQFGTW